MDKKVCESLPFGRSLAVLAKSYFGALAKQLEHLEIERYYSVLIFIESVSAGCTQQHICDNLKMDKVSMVRIIDYLIEKKYIKKVLNPKDRREYLIELSAKAIKKMPEIHSAIAELNCLAMKGISKQGQKELYEYIATIQNNLEALPSEKIYINYKKANKK